MFAGILTPTIKIMVHNVWCIIIFVCPKIIHDPGGAQIFGGGTTAN